MTLTGHAGTEFTPLYDIDMEQLVSEILLASASAPEIRIDNEIYRLCPETIGSATLFWSTLRLGGIDMEIMMVNPHLEALRISTLYPAVATMAISAALLPWPEVEDSRKREATAAQIRNLPSEKIAELLELSATRSRWQELMKLSGLEEEQKLQKRVADLKRSEGGTVTFGGKTIFGTILDAACSRYGWSPRETIWEIPLDIIRMMLADATNTVWLTDEERMKLCLRDENAIDGDTADIDTLRGLTNG